MREQGKSVQEILRLQTRGFDKLDTYGRYLAEKGLRSAITRRRKRIRNTPVQTNAI
jgi:predicted oxidoreductase